jgi:hypothetical protein
VVRGAIHGPPSQSIPNQWGSHIVISSANTPLFILKSASIAFSLTFIVMPVAAPFLVRHFHFAAARVRLSFLRRTWNSLLVSYGNDRSVPRQTLTSYAASPGAQQGTRLATTRHARPALQSLPPHRQRIHRPKWRCLYRSGRRCLFWHRRRCLYWS